MLAPPSHVMVLLRLSKNGVRTFAAKAPMPPNPMPTPVGAMTGLVHAHDTSMKPNVHQVTATDSILRAGKKAMSIKETKRVLRRLT